MASVYMPLHHQAEKCVSPSPQQRGGPLLALIPSTPSSDSLSCNEMSAPKLTGTVNLWLRFQKNHSRPREALHSK